MQKKRLIAKREQALERRLRAIERLCPGLAESLACTHYRNPQPCQGRIAEMGMQASLGRVDHENETARMLSSTSFREAMDAALALTITRRQVALESMQKGLESRNPDARAACACALSDLFLLGKTPNEQWEAIGILLAANGAYVEEAGTALKSLLDLDPANENRKRNLFGKISDMISKPAFGVGIGSMGTALMKFGFLKSGAVVLCAGLLTGALERLISTKGKIRYDPDFIIAKAYSFIEREPEAI